MGTGGEREEKERKEWGDEVKRVKKKRGPEYRQAKTEDEMREVKRN